MAQHEWHRINDQDELIDWCRRCGTVRSRYPAETEPWEYLYPGMQFDSDGFGSFPPTIHEEPACNRPPKEQ